MARFENLGIIKNKLNIEEEKLLRFEREISAYKNKGSWQKEQLVKLFHEMLPNFDHKETGKYLDAKM